MRGRSRCIVDGLEDDAVFGIVDLCVWLLCILHSNILSFYYLYSYICISNIALMPASPSVSKIMIIALLVFDLSGRFERKPAATLNAPSTKTEQEATLQDLRD